MFIVEPHEPILRSCWECNPAHAHLKEARGPVLYYCIVGCGRRWVNGKFLEGFESDEAMNAHLAEACR